MNTPPILLIIFNRPEVTRQTFEAIRQSKPSTLFIAADGYRQDRPGEKELCEQTKIIVANIDWPCEVYHNFLTENIGPCKRVPTAIDWFFDHVESGIILEDDCLPDSSFFTFCQEILEKYKDDTRVMNISGNNFQDGIKRSEASYYFSYYPSTWGWATWRRAWKLYDKNMLRYPNFLKENKIQAIIPNKEKEEQRYWLKFLEQEYSGKFIFWDVKWLFTIWSYDATSIIPNNNLITNIGFGNDATHTKGEFDLSIPTQKITQIIHPKEVIINKEADRYLYKKLYKTTLIKKIKFKLKNFLG